MNFLNRRMFANGGGANQEYAVLTDGSTKYYNPATFEQQLRSLSESEIFALQNSANSGQISFSPGLSNILDSVVRKKRMPVYAEYEQIDELFPNNSIRNVDPNYGNELSYGSVAGDYVRRAKGIYGPALRGITNSLVSEDTIDKYPFLKGISEYNSPYYGEGSGIIQDFRSAEARGGRTKEELDAILGEGLQTIPGQQIQDFQSEIDDVADTAIVTEVSGPSGPTPITTSETLSIEGGPGSLESRRLAYEKEMIGRDEFGDLLPEGRLEQDDEIATLLDEIKPIEQKVDVDKTEADTLADNEAKFGGLSQDEFRATIDDAAIPKLPEIERPITDINIEEQEERRKQNDPVSRKLDQPGFFGSDRFLNFIRNVGGELVRTGQFGEGLASGAAKASEERAARELMADKEERDYRMKLRLAKAEADLEARNKLADGPSDSMKKEFRTVAQEINADYNDIVSANNTLEIVGRVEDIISNEDTTSFKAFAGELLEKGQSLFDIDGNPTDSGKSFADLEPRTRAKVLLNQIKQKNIRDILGESGKTISNLDRQIVEELVGSISLGKTPQETLEALKLTKESIFNNLNASQNRLKSNYNFANVEGGLYLISDNTRILDYLKTGILNQTAYDNAYENQSIRKITLEE